MPQCEEKIKKRNAKLPKHLRTKIRKASPDLMAAAAAGDPAASDAAFRAWKGTFAVFDRFKRVSLPFGGID